jgi:putative peptide zinc metalloprotease protein
MDRLVNLPFLREELSLYAGAAAADGAPTWSLHDPVRNQFFRIDWPTFEILARWSHTTAEAIATAVSNETTLQIDADDVSEVRRFLLDNQLCQMHDAEATAWCVSRESAQHGNLWQWLLHHYLFFRIPLLRPDRWLSRNAARVEMFYSKRFFQLTGMVLIVGLLECFRQWSHFSSTLVDRFSLQGVLGYAAALSFVKVLHELGHAFTAKRKGCRVPTMGVAFLVMWPVAYTDVNEVWKLPDRKDRFAVGAAGIVTELIVAAWATFAWAFLEDGTVRDAVFLLATTTWISTVLVNASPFMRFDGYFLLSDLLDFPNLHARAFALARWDLRERLFSLREPVPEVLPALRHKGLVVFAWLVWLYRLTLFLGIAAMVYHFFIKALGVVMFVVEIGYFVIHPLWREIGEWRRRSTAIRGNKRMYGSLMVLLLLLLLGAIPWSTHLQSQGILHTARHFPLYAPDPARIVELPRVSGAHVKAGELLMALEFPDLEYRAKKAQDEISRLGWQLEVAGFNDEMRAMQNVTREQLAGARTELSGMHRQQQRLALAAPFDGVLVDVPPALAEGVWVNRQERLGELIDPTHWEVQTYLGESEVQRVKVGDTGWFYPETPGKRAIKLQVIHVDIDVTRQLPEPMLSVQHGGQVLVHERNNQLIPDKALYRVVLSAAINPESSASIPMSERGQVVINGDAKSWLGAYTRTAFTVLIRESGW